MQNKAETKELLALNARLANEADMIGWLCTVHRNAVNYADNPEASQRVQDQLNRANNLIVLAYVWALLDEHGFNENSKWIRPNDRLELKAWKHIRHTGAHAPGGRAKGYLNEFDAFMASADSGMSGLKQNCTYSADSITIADGMNHSFFRFVQELVKVAIGHCSNNIHP